MPVPDQVTVNSSTANGLTTVFPYSFKIVEEGDIVVELDGVVQTTGFTISGVGEDSGGNVTFSSAPASGVEVIRYLDPPLRRITDYQQHGDYNAETLDADFDRLWTALQAKGHDADRAIKLPMSETEDQVITENASERAGKVLVFDAVGKIKLIAASIGTSLLSLADYAGASLIGFIQAGTGAIAQTVQDALRERVSVTQFGAKGDGVNDDTVAIALADAYARSIGAVLRFPAGTFMVSQVVVYTGSNWEGSGRDATTIKQIAGSNKDLVYGYNSNANWGSSAPTNLVNGYAIRYITLDGNRSGNTSGSGLAVYGSRPILEDVFIKNCAEHGMRTEYTDAALGIDTFAMEGWFSNVRIDTVGKHGWLNNGPHDSVAINVIVIDASQAAANTYDGFYLDSKSVTRHIACHAWTRSWAVRANSALNIRPGGAGHEFSGGCNFEGGYNANVIIAGQNCLFDPTTRYYAAWNGLNILMTGAATLCTVMGKLDGPGAGRPACVGIQLGQAAGDYVAANIIDVHCAAQENGNVYFHANNTGGNNRIRVKSYNATSASITGTPKPSDDMEIMLLNYGGTSHLNNRRQRTTIGIGANASVTWSFPYQFAALPVITFSPASPGASLTSGMWISYLSNTSVTIYNNNATTATLHIIAEATN